MSRFCGKCDLYDWIGDYTDEEINKMNFYIHHKGREYKLDVHNQYDAALYYPYIVAIGTHNKDGSGTIILSSDSFIDEEEKQHLSWYTRDVLKEWRRCKRKKIKFNPKEVFKKINWGCRDNSQLQAVIDDVAKNGDRAEFKDIHFNLQEYYRREWYKYLIEIGYDKRKAYDWVFKGFFASEEEMQERLKEDL